MAKQNVMDPETAIEAGQKALETALELQEKAEDTYKQALEDLFDATSGTLRQTRTAATTMQSAMPWAAAMRPAADALFDIQEKALENSRTAAKTAFENYRRSVAEPVRKLSRETATKLSSKRA
jgi:phytoene/squalene synthetase